MTVTWKDMRDYRRVALLLTLSVVCMGILGVAAMATQYGKEGWVRIWQLDGLGFSFVVGAFVGLITAPIVVS